MLSCSRRMAKIGGQAALLHASVEELRETSKKVMEKKYLCSRTETKYSALGMGRSGSFFGQTPPTLGFFFYFLKEIEFVKAVFR